MTKAADLNSASSPFDPATLRFDQSVGVKKLLTTLPVRKPNRQDFVRVHPHPDYRLAPGRHHVTCVASSGDTGLDCPTDRAERR